MKVQFEMDLRDMLTSKILAYWYDNTTMKQREEQTKNDNAQVGKIKERQGGMFLYVANILAKANMLDDFLATLQ